MDDFAMSLTSKFKLWHPHGMNNALRSCDSIRAWTPLLRPRILAPLSYPWPRQLAIESFSAANLVNNISVKPRLGPGYMTLVR